MCSSQKRIFSQDLTTVDVCPKKYVAKKLRKDHCHCPWRHPSPITHHQENHLIPGSESYCFGDKFNCAGINSTKMPKTKRLKRRKKITRRRPNLGPGQCAITEFLASPEPGKKSSDQDLLPEHQVSEFKTNLQALVKRETKKKAFLESVNS